MVQLPRLSAHHQTQDDGFHEIQLNGKQLVFLFMAATVVSVVIFLCGVLVGRGVRAERAVAGSEVAAATSSPAPDTAVAGTTPSAAPAGADPRKAAPPDTAEELTYFDRLENKQPEADDLKPHSGSTEKAAAPARAKTPEPPVKDQPAPRPAPKAATTQAPADGGFALQVAALRELGEAEAIAKKLSSKGYSAYVLAPATGTPSVYRVRVGQFKSRHDAEAAAAKLQKEEQFKPWITR
jgi:cell division septation protein DedD